MKHGCKACATRGVGASARDGRCACGCMHATSQRAGDGGCAGRDRACKQTNEQRTGALRPQAAVGLSAARARGPHDVRPTARDARKRDAAARPRAEVPRVGWVFVCLFVRRSGGQSPCAATRCGLRGSPRHSRGQRVVAAFPTGSACGSSRRRAALCARPVGPLGRVPPGYSSGAQGVLKGYFEALRPRCVRAPRGQAAADDVPAARALGSVHRPRIRCARPPACLGISFCLFVSVAVAAALGPCACPPVSACVRGCARARSCARPCTLARGVKALSPHAACFIWWSAWTVASRVAGAWASVCLFVCLFVWLVASLVVSPRRRHRRVLAQEEGGVLARARRALPASHRLPLLVRRRPRVLAVLFSFLGGSFLRPAPALAPLPFVAAPARPPARPPARGRPGFRFNI